jgi:Na+-driven multidrug efflux pump
LLKETGYGKLEKEHIKFYPRMAFNIFRNGIPVGIQSCLFTISGVMLQTSINSFGKEATAAQSMAGSVSGITYSIVAAFSQALLVFVSQNYGARRIDRIKKAIPQSMILSASVTLGMGIIINLARSPICHIFTQDSVIIHYMYTNFFYWGIFQCINSIMEVLNNVVKGLGRPITSMVAALTGNLAVTFIWLRTAFVKFPTIEVVYMSYPAAWIVSTVIFIFLTAIIWKKAKEEMTEGKILE